MTKSIYSRSYGLWPWPAATDAAVTETDLILGLLVRQLRPESRFAAMGQAAVASQRVDDDVGGGPKPGGLGAGHYALMLVV